MERLRSVQAHLGEKAMLAAGEQQAFMPAPTPAGGLFVTDYSALPTATADPAVAKRDIDEFGYCLLRDLLTPAECSALASRVLEQANAEESLAAMDTEAASALRRMEDMPQWSAQQGESGESEREMAIPTVTKEHNQQVHCHRGQDVSVLLSCSAPPGHILFYRWEITIYLYELYY
jgi:hypothetical protein